MAKAVATKEQAKKGTEKDSKTGYRVSTKKFKVYEVWRSKGSLEDGLKAALKFLGKSDAATQKYTKGSVYSWFKEFDRKFQS